MRFIPLVFIFYAILAEAQSEVSEAAFMDVVTALKFSPLPSMWTVPIEVSVFALGLEGNGHLGVNISHETLQRWLEHLDSVISERVVAPLPDRFSAAQTSSASKQHYQEFAPVIQYKYHYNLITLSPNVIKAIEMALERNFRDDGNELQINPRVIENLLEDLLHYLEISLFKRMPASAFNIFILNPHKNWAGGLQYGYRVGLSEEEAKVVYEDKALLALARSLAFNQTGQVPVKPSLVGRAKPGVHNPHTTVSRNDDYIKVSRLWAEDIKKEFEKIAVGPLALDTFLKSLIPNPNGRDTRSRIDNNYLLLQENINVTTENCLLDVWVGKARLAFIDLAAGPFEWGPSIGGEGLRTKHSLPNVTTFLVNATESTVEGETVVEAKYDWDMIEAEKVLIEDFLAAECADGETTPECIDLRKKLKQIELFVRKAQPVDKVAETDFEHANAFSFFTHESGQSAHSDSLIQHQFLGHLNALLSSSLRHLVTPTLSPPLNLPTTFAPRVVFHIYILRNHNNDVGLSSLISELQAALEVIKAPSQVFSFAVRTLDMDDDPRLALAFASSLRSAVTPALTPSGLFDSERRMYLDSKSLEFELTRIDDEEDARPTNDHHAKGSREIPIFLFSLDDSYLPILIDKYYQSQVVGNLVVAIQSTQRLWKSDLSCNNKPILWDLKHPIKAIVQSTLQVLTGIIPMHVEAGGPLNRITNDWKWSVGAHACSATSSGIEVSELQRDIAHRGYITSTIRYAHQSIEDALLRLSNIRLPQAQQTKLLDLVRERSRVHLEKFDEARSLTELYELVQKNLTAFAECSHSPRDECFEAIPRFIFVLNLLTALLSDIYEGASLSQCDAPQPFSRIGAAGYLVAGSLCLLACLRVVFSGPSKPKINQD